MNVNSLNQEGWGWKLQGDSLVPMMMDLDPAPPEILNVIRCKCKSASMCQCLTNVCSCRKNGLHCVAACDECHGWNCNNVSEDKADISDSDDDDGQYETDDFERNIFDIFDD